MTQSDEHLLGSKKKTLVVRFNQQAFEDFLSDDSSGPSKRLAKSKKARKVWVRKAAMPTTKADGDVLPVSDDAGMAAEPSVVPSLGASPATAPAHQAKAHGGWQKCIPPCTSRKVEDWDVCP